MAPIGHLKYVEVFQKFKNVVDDCFSNTLKPTFKTSIKEFRTSYLSLGISVTPKVHAIINHVEEFCTKQEKGLGIYSKQAMESVHHDFDETWQSYKVSEIHSDYKNRLLNSIIAYNSNHI